MPATFRTTGARLGARRSLTVTLFLGLITGLGLSVPATTSMAQAAPVIPVSADETAGAEAPAVELTEAEVRAEQKAEKKAAKKARKLKKAKRKAKLRKKARIRARKARRAHVGRIIHAKGIAMAQRGDSYGYGAAGPNAFDCSGLVQYAYHRAGLRGMPRSSAAQAGHTRRISKAALRPGDLMFFANGGGVYHVGMFAGRAADGAPLMVHSSRPGTPVQLARPWTSSWFAGTVR